MRKVDIFWVGIGPAVAAIAGLTFWTCLSDIERAKERLRQGSQTFASRYGTLEYAVAGIGTPVLVVHGTGGGFDQGLAFGERISAAGRQVISPSRFGYLRSALPDDPSPAAQADAFVDLLDELRIERAPVIGVSAGALSAIQFALRHPDRCSGLIAVVPATYAPNRPAQAAPTPTQVWIMERALKSDLLFWLGMHSAEDEMIRTLLATDPRLVKRAPPQERDRARKILKDILPVSERAPGLLNDMRLTSTLSPTSLRDIAVPTLAISAEDDRFGTAAAARHIAAEVPNARVLILANGGHVWIGHEEEVFAEIEQFLAVIEPRQAVSE